MSMMAQEGPQSSRKGPYRPPRDIQVGTTSHPDKPTPLQSTSSTFWGRKLGQPSILPTSTSSAVELDECEYLETAEWAKLERHTVDQELPDEQELLARLQGEEEYLTRRLETIKGVIADVTNLHDTERRTGVRQANRSSTLFRCLSRLFSGPNHKSPGAQSWFGEL